MAESDSEIYYGVKAGELRQLAWLAGEFYDALVKVVKLPEALTHDIILAWFEVELEESRVVLDDDGVTNGCPITLR